MSTLPRSAEAGNFGLDGDEKGSRRANPIDIHVGSRVRFRRMLLGMSQEKLGEKLGLTFQQVQKYEKGTNRLSVAFLVRLQDLYEVPLDHLIPSSGGTFHVPELGRQTVKLVSHFEAIRCQKVRGHLTTLVRSLAASQRSEADRTRRISLPDSAGSP